MLTIVATFVTVPLTLAQLGEGSYGRWLLISSLNAYLNLVMLGAPMASVRQFARALGGGDDQALRRTTSTVSGVFAVLGCVAVVASLLLLGFFVNSYDLDAKTRQDSLRAFVLLAAATALGFASVVPASLLAATDRFVERNAATVVSVVFRVIGIAVFLKRSPTLVTLALIQVVSVTAELCIVTWFAKRARPDVQFLSLRIDRAIARELFSFSIYVLVLQAASQIAFQTDALVIGKTVGVSAIPAYNVANSLNVYILQFVIGIAAVIMPSAAKAVQRGDNAELRILFTRWMPIAITIGVVAAVGLFTIGPGFIAVWVGNEIADRATSSVRVLAIGTLFFIPARGVALPLLMGAGDAKKPTLVFLLMAILNVGMSIFLSRAWGLPGIAMGTTVPSILLAIFLFWRACRLVGLGSVHFLARQVCPQLLVAGGVMFVFVTFWVPNQPSGIIGIVVGGALVALVTSALSAGTWYGTNPQIAGVMADQVRSIRNRFRTRG